MHPRVFLDSFWRNDIANEVFVAMAFKPEFNRRWTEIFKPAIESVTVGGQPLKANRVDIRKSGDSILTEIMNGIAHSQLVLADISVTDRWKENGKDCWSVNGNVMYEVGLALACRQCVEVILLRDENDKERGDLLFDVSTIPYVRFAPDDVTKSVKLVRDAIVDRLNARNLEKDLRVSALVESLGELELYLIRATADKESFSWPGVSRLDSMIGGATIALSDLLGKKILRLVSLPKEAQPRYVWTRLGRAVANILMRISTDSHG